MLLTASDKAIEYYYLLDTEVQHVQLLGSSSKVRGHCHVMQLKHKNNMKN